MSATALAPPVETAGVEPARVEELVALRNRIDAEIAESVRAFARREVEARLGQIAAEQDTVQQVDRRLAAHDLPSLGPRRIADLARTIVVEVAPEKFAERARAARRDRHVTIGPAGDGMAVLRAYLPAEQGIACYAALRKAVTEHWVSPEPVTRTRGQVMADTLVERLTGAAVAAPVVGVEVQVLVPIEALVSADGPLPVELPGFGPVPAELLVGPGRTAWRRLITEDGVVIGADSRRRTFTGVLADVVRSRDRGRWTDGGRTTPANGAGKCAFHDLVREIPL
ncbi:DUF222 domain-containing protein [Pseudonocardia pini]|uniref:DUF222 domain-containing protein n=1 Tax=Pseudonocardia pini TaxID=2758030 RepID=UPI0015F10442|nr:DUF222 domain-containing protein [Pseudonocardia pini]